MKSRFFHYLSVLLLILAMNMFMTSANAEEWSLVDNENVIVKITGFEEDAVWGKTMKIYLENKTDKTLLYGIDNCAINGVMNDPLWTTEVPAGAKANEEVSWFSLYGNVESVGMTKIDFTLSVSDGEDLMAEPLHKQDYTVYPLGETAVVLDEYTTSAEDVVLFDNDDVSMTIIGFRNDEIWGYTADVYIQNKTEKTMMFSVDSATINGFMCDPFWALEVRPATSAYTSISWMQEELDANGIADVEEIMLSIRVSDSSDWMADAMIEQQFTITP